MSASMILSHSVLATGLVSIVLIFYSLKESFNSNLKVLLPLVVLKYFSRLRASFLERKYSQKINLKGLLGAVDFELPRKWFVRRCLRFSVNPI